MNNVEWGNLFILDANGRVRRAYNHMSGESYPHILFNSIAAVDIDNNGYKEIIGASSNAVHAIKDTYDRLVWTTRTNCSINRVVVDRIDENNYGILALSDSILYSISLDGTIKHIYNTSAGIRKMEIIELGPSNSKHIALVRNDEQLVILDREFNVCLESPVIGNIEEISAFDINDDGLNEIILGTKDGVYMLSSKYMITNRYVTKEPVSGIYYADWNGDDVKELIFSSGEYIYAVSRKSGTGRENRHRICHEEHYIKGDGEG